MSESTRRVARNAALDSAFVGQKFTIVEAVALKDTDVKFTAWITGARGLNGFAIMNDATGLIHIVGLTTLMDGDARGAITNMEFATVNGRPSRSVAQDANVNAATNADLIARVRAGMVAKSTASTTVAAKPIDAKPVNVKK